MYSAGIFAFPGGTNIEKMNPFLKACALMRIAPKQEVVAPAAIENANVDQPLKKHLYQQSKKKWWRCENPGCNFATKNKYSQ